MNRLVSAVAVLALVALAASGFGAALPSPEDLVAAADRTRNGWDSFAVDVTITNFKGGKADRPSRYEVLIKGADKSLVKFEDPQDKGKLLLMEPDAMWLYLPTASRPVRVTPLQRLSGNASNGDVAQTTYAGLYDVVLAGEEDLGGERAWILDLTARRKAAMYQQVRLWIAQETRLPLKAEFRLTSGKATKLSLFEEYAEEGGRRVLRRQVIHDLLRKNERTVMEFRNYEPRALPDKLFNRNYLHQF